MTLGKDTVNYHLSRFHFTKFFKDPLSIEREKIGFNGTTMLVMGYNMPANMPEEHQENNQTDDTQVRLETFHKNAGLNRGQLEMEFSDSNSMQ